MLLQVALFHSFLRLNNNSIVYICSIFFIHSSADGYLGCVHVLATINSAAVNIRVHVSFQILGVGLLDCWFGLVAELCSTHTTPWSVTRRFLHPGDFPSKNTGVGCISFSRESFQPRDQNWVSYIACGLLHCRQILYRMSHQGNQDCWIIWELYF